ncbi:MAG: metal-dependent hydrolase family protein [Planctomycetota bacterium]|jgi:imidazolonepropionase-like amidohydrolase
MPDNTLVFGAIVLDGKGGPPLEDGAVLVRDTRIEKTGRVGSFPVPKDVVKIDATGGCLVPGFIDTHSHILFAEGDLPDSEDPPFSLPYFQAARNLHETLLSGVLTVRDAGGADLGVKRAVEVGYVFGPSLLLSITPLSPTGGPADGTQVSGRKREPLIPHPGRPTGVCDGEEGVRAKVREVIRAGADVIKVYATGRLTAGGEDPPPLFTAAELSAVVDEARTRGLRVMAHAQGSEAARFAAEAGVASIEHGYRLNAKAIRALAKAGTVLVPTLAASAAAAEAARHSGDAENAERAAGIHREHLASVRRAVKAGVRIALGSNGGRRPHGEALQELALLAEAGLSPADVIVAATRNGAELLGLQEDVGVIEAGKQADLVLLRKNPLDDLASPTRKENVLLLMKEGEIIHSVL